MHFIKKIYQWLLPHHCICCNCASHTSIDLCSICAKSLPYLHSDCHLCATPLNETTGAICGKCLQYPPTYDRVIAIFAYDLPINKMISDIKFHQKLNIAHVLSQIMAKKILMQYENKPLPQCLIPIPLHNKRLAERGYNQSLEIARNISKSLRIPINKTACQRVLNTKPQMNLSHEDRKRNLRNAFAIRQKLPYQHIALIDDVFTTGSTVNELTKVIKQSGVEQVDIWCCAKSLRKV